MSTVRMCDRCGDIFKEGIEGSAVGTVTLMKTNRDGTPYPVQQAQDICPNCGAGASIRPRLALTMEDTYDSDELQRRFAEYQAAKKELEDKFGDVAGT